MDDASGPTPQVEDHADTQERATVQERNRVPRIVFVVVSVVFLVSLAFGSIEARIWRFGRLYFEDRDIRQVWAYFGERLPDLPAPGVFSALYWISIGVLIVGTILGLWLFLGSDDDDSDAATRTDAPERASTHG